MTQLENARQNLNDLAARADAAQHFANECESAAYEIQRRLRAAHVEQDTATDAKRLGEVTREAADLTRDLAAAREAHEIAQRRAAGAQQQRDHAAEGVRMLVEFEIPRLRARIAGCEADAVREEEKARAAVRHAEELALMFRQKADSLRRELAELAGEL